MKKITEEDLLDAISKEVASKFPQKGEITVASFMKKMEKDGHPLTQDQAAYWLTDQVKKGKLKMRYGIVGGRTGRIWSKAKS